MLAFFRNMSRRQWLTLVVFSLADFCQAVCVSLQAPFYPAEAERKGATATQYGLVFGVFELTVFLVSPLMGKNLNKWGAKRVFNLGILTTGTCSILFGLLDKIDSGTWFISLSVVIRIVEAVGNSGFLTASFSIIAKEFPDHVATMFASLETFFGLGLIVGPSVGGALYELGGYVLPFVSLGGCLVCAACFTYFVLPSDYDEGMDGHTSDRGVMQALKVPSILLAAFSILCASSSIGFLLTTVEPHMRQFNLSPVTMGLLFVLNGGSYAICAPIFGYLCDRRCRPISVNILGALALMTSFLLLGPAPFLPLNTTMSVCLVALVVHGVGIGAMLVSSFATAHRQAVDNGFADNLDTYGLISGLWTSTFALGAFVGPTVAGVLLDHFGMRNATMFIVVFAAAFVAVTALYLMIKWVKTTSPERKGYVEIGETSNVSETTVPPTVTMDERFDLRRSPSIGYDSAASGGNSSSTRTTPNSGNVASPLIPAPPPPSRNASRTSSSLRPIVHVSAEHSSYLATPQGNCNPLSPKSPFQSGATGLFGGVLGYSGPILRSPSARSGGSSFPIAAVLPEEGAEPHQIDFREEEERLLAPPPARNASSRVNRKKSSKKDKNSRSGQ